MKRLLITAFIILSVSILKSQELDVPLPFNSSSTITADTICVKYNLLPGDTLIYRVSGQDSLALNFQEPILRKRIERHQYVVDSVDELKRIHITQTMTHFIWKESKGDIRNVERVTSTWLNFPVSYVIDESGRRYSYSVPDSSRAMISPGGPFSPFLFSDIGIYCEEVNKNWLVKSYDELVENGVPFPLFNHTTLYRFQDDIDTLDEKCHRIELIRTGQGSYKYPVEDKMQRITTKINSGGMLDISVERGIPVHYMMNQEQKTTIKLPSGKEQPGWKYTLQYFTLEELKRAKVPEEGNNK